MTTLQTFSSEEATLFLDQVFHSKGLYESPELDEIVLELKRVTAMVNWYREHEVLQNQYQNDSYIQNQLNRFINPEFQTPSEYSRYNNNGFSKYWSQKYRQARFGK